MNKKKSILLSLLAAVMLSMLFGMTGFAASRTISLKAGKFAADKKSQREDITYFRITVPKSGYLTITSYAQYRGTSNAKYGQNIELCSSKKKVISGTEKYCSSTDKYVTYYAVKKGTYYIKVENIYYNSDVKAKYTFKAVTEKSGSTRKKAVSIKKNKTVNGLLLAGEKAAKVDYYKLRLTKSQVLQLSVNSRVDGYFYVRIVPASSKVTLTGNQINLQNKDSKTWKTSKKVPAGTYYIEVYKSTYSSDLVSGCYSLKWK